jgi:5,10-methylenetetrahydromethanopterin reductase
MGRVALELSCAFATSIDTPEHVRIAESLGYRRAWLYDSPAICPDVWVSLCRAAERTQRIALGPGVLVPSLRHPMTTAAAIATLAGIAGAERVVVGVGSGFTARMAMGQRALRWADVSEYVRAVKALLAGEQVIWDGAPVRMLHAPGYAAPRPIHVPFVIAAAGPKGIAAAQELADGVFTSVPLAGFDWSVLLAFGTVLRDGEDASTARVFDAAGHAAAVMLHWRREHRLLGEDTQAWEAAYDDIPEAERHLSMHEGHLMFVHDRDRPFVTPQLMVDLGLALSPDAWRERLAAMEDGGATEIAYQPAGPNIPGELEAFAEAARG